MERPSDQDLEARYTMRVYDNVRIPLTLVSGEGSYVRDASGRRYLDLYGAHAVTILGHAHPRWVEALVRQAGELGFYSNACYHPLRARAAERVIASSYPAMKQVFFCNSGAEANETALKLARKATGRRIVVSMEGAFHGRTLGALSVTGFVKMRDAARPNVDSSTWFVPLGDLGAIEALEPREIAAVMLEPIQSVGGVRLAPPEYYRALRRFCDRHRIVLIFDEVQTGNGRTGKWFAGQHWGVEPDIVTTAKGAGGGFPVALVLASAAICDTVEPGDLGSTFGGGPLAAACVLATYEVIHEEGLVERVAARSPEIVARLGALGGVREVRGLGYLLGVECEVPARELQRRFLGEGVLVGTSSDPNTFRLLPPLNLKDREWEEFLGACERVLRG